MQLLTKKLFVGTTKIIELKIVGLYLFAKLKPPLDDKDNKLIYHGHTLPCLHDDVFCKPITSTKFTIVWFPVELYLVFYSQFC